MRIDSKINEAREGTPMRTPGVFGFVALFLGLVISVAALGWSQIEHPYLSFQGHRFIPSYGSVPGPVMIKSDFIKLLK